MSIAPSGTKARLRFNHRGGADGARQLLGVVIEERIPGNQPLHLRVDRPTVLPQTDAGQRLSLLGPVPGAVAQPFIIEAAPRPTVVSAAGVTFNKRIPTLSVVPGTPGRFVEVGNQPLWVAAPALTPAIPAAGLVLKGRYDGFVPDWPFDPNGTVPNSGHRPAGHLLRVRWTGTAIAAEVADGGGNAGFTYTLVNPSNIAPGSVEIDATIGGNTLLVRDDGAGRLFGQESTGGASATGTINYLTGVFTIAFSTATDAANVTVDYEHSCLYLPLDISLDWDAELASG